MPHISADNAQLSERGGPVWASVSMSDSAATCRAEAIARRQARAQARTAEMQRLQQEELERRATEEVS
jgi:hypothetical protein